MKERSHFSVRNTSSNLRLAAENLLNLPKMLNVPTQNICELLLREKKYSYSPPATDEFNGVNSTKSEKVDNFLAQHGSMSFYIKSNHLDFVYYIIYDTLLPLSFIYGRPGIGPQLTFFQGAHYFKRIFII